MLPNSWQAALTGMGIVALSSSVTATDTQTYVNHTITGIEELNIAFYSPSTGLWDNAWWNSGNALTTFADFAKARRNEANSINLGGYIRNTFNQAQKTNVQTVKTSNKNGMMTSHYCFNGAKGCLQKREGMAAQGFANFINQYYDDEGWWALGLIHSYDATGDRDYLQAAQNIFHDMQTGAGTPCGGGIYWSKDRQYVNAIANELYLSVAASLANRVPSNGNYLAIAKSQWNWFMNSGMINSQNLINDGLDGNCKNNGQLTWSYNQGVILGGAAELTIATGDQGYINRAKQIASAAIHALSSSSGVLVEVGNCEPSADHCGRDGQQFKGVFIRNLGYLNQLVHSADFSNFIKRNADAIWDHDRSSDNRFGVAWDGPYYTATGPSHSSALDVLVAAISA